MNKKTYAELLNELNSLGLGINFEQDNVFLHTFYTDYAIVFIFFCVGVVLALALFVLSYLFGTTTMVLDAEKTSAYECGFDPFQESREPLNLKFFKVAILFIVFDIEIIFLFPWSVVVVQNCLHSSFYLYSILPFIFVLVLGLVYEYVNKSLDW